jgi:hypothetical protein
MWSVVGATAPGSWDSTQPAQQPVAVAPKKIESGQFPYNRALFLEA